MKYAVYIYEIDNLTKKYKILDEFDKEFDSHKKALNYANSMSLSTDTIHRGYIINEVCSEVVK